MVAKSILGSLDNVYSEKYKLCYIPYSSIGKKDGLMECIELTEMIIEDECGRFILKVSHPKIAISDRKNITNNGVEIILNRELNL